MMTRTWPYGTTKTVTVLETAPGNPCILLCKDQDREGYVLIGGAGDENAAKAGDVGTIVFTKGGPFGGYWLYKANAERLRSPASGDKQDALVGRDGGKA